MASLLGFRRGPGARYGAGKREDSSSNQLLAFHLGRIPTRVVGEPGEIATKRTGRGGWIIAHRRHQALNRRTLLVYRGRSLSPYRQTAGIIVPTLSGISPTASPSPLKIGPRELMSTSSCFRSLNTTSTALTQSKEPATSNGKGGLRNRRSVWSINTEAFADGHVATFPPILVRSAILAGTEASDFVRDPILGSGTVGQVAIEEGRRFVGIELKSDYAELALRRLEW